MAHSSVSVQLDGLDPAGSPPYADPFERFPDEILAEVFASGNIVLIPFPNNILASTFRINGVCRRWRSVAISTPALWSKIHFIIPNVQETDLSGAEKSSILCAFARICFERSGSHPLDVNMGDGVSFEALSCLAETSSRWRQLRINAVELAHLFDCIEFQGFPLLRYLHILPAVRRYDSRWNNAHLTTTKQQSRLQLPQLRLLYREPKRAYTSPNDGLEHHGTSNIFTPSLTHAHLSLRFLSHRQLSEVLGGLSAMSQLTHLHVGGGSGLSNAQKFPQDLVINLPKVQRLSIWFPSTDANRFFLSHCRLPSLTHLRIDERYLPETLDDFGTDVNSMLVGCPRMLQSFSLQSSWNRHSAVRAKAFVAALKPCMVALSFWQECPEVLTWILRGMLEGNEPIVQVQELAVYTRHQHTVDALSEIIREVLANNAHEPLTTSNAILANIISTGPDRSLVEPKRIDIHSFVTVEDWKMGGISRRMSRQLVSQDNWDARVHEYPVPTQRRIICHLPPDFWSSSTGDVDMKRPAHRLA